MRHSVNSHGSNSPFISSYFLYKCLFKAIMCLLTANMAPQIYTVLRRKTKKLFTRRCWQVDFLLLTDIQKQDFVLLPSITCCIANIGWIGTLLHLWQVFITNNQSSLYKAGLYLTSQIFFRKGRHCHLHFSHNALWKLVCCCFRHLCHFFLDHSDIPRLFNTFPWILTAVCNRVPH